MKRKWYSKQNISMWYLYTNNHTTCITYLFVVFSASIFLIRSATATSCTSCCKTFTSISHLALPKWIHDINISCRHRFRLPQWLASIVLSSSYFTFRYKPSVNQSKTSFVANVTSERSFSACKENTVYTYHMWISCSLGNFSYYCRYITISKEQYTRNILFIIIVTCNNYIIIIKLL